MAATFQVSMMGEIPVITISGYFDEDLGRALAKETGKCLQNGKRHFLFEFSGCPLINSLGISHLLEITIQISEDYQGVLVLIAVPQVVRKVLKLASIVPQAKMAESIQEALAILKTA